MMKRPVDVVEEGAGAGAVARPRLAEVRVGDGRHGGFDPLKFRADFPILGTVINGKPLVYLDNAATTQKPRR